MMSNKRRTNAQKRQAKVLKQRDSNHRKLQKQVTVAKERQHGKNHPDFNPSSSERSMYRRRSSWRHRRSPWRNIRGRSVLFRP